MTDPHSKNPAPKHAKGANKAVLIAFALLGIGLALVMATLTLTAQKQTSVLPSAVGGPFALTTHDGKPYTEKNLLGHPTLIFFGFTHCPDICPTALSEMTQVFDTLGKDAGKVGALFITVDPERDDQALMKLYLSSFDSHITGLTGTPEAIAATMKAYRAYAKKVPLEKGGYTMDHSAAVYLMNKNGEFVALFDMKRSPEEAAKALRAYL
jgi:protein SCO1/2